MRPAGGSGMSAQESLKAFPKSQGSVQMTQSLVSMITEAWLMNVIFIRRSVRSGAGPEIHGRPLFGARVAEAAFQVQTLIERPLPPIVRQSQFERDVRG